MNSKVQDKVKTLVEEYVLDKYGVSLSTLVSSYKSKQVVVEEDDDDNEEVVVPVSSAKTVNDLMNKPSEKKVVEKKTKTTDKPKCVYLMEKGKNKGQVCGTSVCEESTSGKYCKKHLTQETKPEKKEKVEKKVDVKKDEPLLTKSELKEMIEKRTTTISIVRNKHGHYEHEDTGIVLDRATNKAIGKQNKNGTVDPLSEDDIDMCKNLGFKFVIPHTINSKEEKENVEEDDMDEDDIDDYDMDDDEIDE